MRRSVRTFALALGIIGISISGLSARADAAPRVVHLTGATPPKTHSTAKTTPPKKPAAKKPAAKKPAPAAKVVAGPAFAAPKKGQTLVAGKAFVFTVRPLKGATGYLFSFVQNGAMVWQNLAFEGRLSGVKYSVSPGSTGYGNLAPGPLQVMVRAALGNGQWTAATALNVIVSGSTLPKQPVAGKVLYQTTMAVGAGKWTGRGWSNATGLLLNNGTGKGEPLYAPYRPGGVLNYAVEAQIRVDNGTPCSKQSFGLFARSVPGTSSSGLYAGTYTLSCNGDTSIGIGRTPTTATGVETTQGFQPGSDYHTYRLEVQGNQVRFLIDDVVLLSTTDNTYTDGGSVGIFDKGAQLSVRSFRVIALSAAS